MPSTKPKIQLYIDPDVEPHLNEWRSKRATLTDSAALNELLREFFGINQPEPIEPFDWRWAIKEAIEPLTQRIEAIESQMNMEREFPQPGAYQEALETAVMQQYVIEELQQEINSLGESPSDSPEAETYTEQIDDEISKMLADAPLNPPNLDECVIRAKAILEAQGITNKEKLKDCCSEENLMQIIYITSPSLYVEEAEEILRRLLEEIPANPSLAEILDSDEPIELNLEGDSPSDSLGESGRGKLPEEQLNHKDLATRLNVKSNTLRGARNRADFKNWSQQHDPYGLVWEFDKEASVYRGFKPSEI